MKKFSNYSKSFQSNFFDLIDHKISFDFILGMFLAVFKKKIWDDNLFVINKKLIEDKHTLPIPPSLDLPTYKLGCIL